MHRTGRLSTLSPMTNLSTARFAGNSYLPRYSLKLNRTLELLLASIPLAP